MDIDWPALVRGVVPIAFTVGVVVALLWRRRTGQQDQRPGTLRTVVFVINGGLLGVVVGVLIAVLVTAVAFT